MKKLLILCGFILSCGYVSAQNYGATYTPYSRPSVDNYNYNQQQTFNFQQRPFGYQRQTQVTYQRVTGTTKSGHTAPFRIKYINGQAQSIEYYQSYQGWVTCYAYSPTDKGFIADDYEQAYDYKVKPTYNSAVYYF
ncbi:hypothetical protein [Alistipes sp. An54]|uniref:hypothetical protein n=1 Tax=Alistipes sp. An54 TaxID=1965645 RepID=UPI001178500A|nr:hypothetical protein [Alistipes sp. An54]